ncbi:signal-regulatory protein beta-1-like isoform X1 [Scyliorhinus canicula]|uniref:signal-regulatory protein beta-1-like isoform X1 n=1 Tax=Scyliorhinus canicula TaxID=7830 RepID=UPI0018F79F1E|nr:signal-regulatory protein beta-1-like isoform X1 [Scyliorhinus canicula]
MSSNSIFLFMLLTLPMIISTAGAPATSISVSQSPKQVSISRGTNITFYCIIPLSHDNVGVEVRWWKQGENKYLANGVDGRKRFDLKSKGGGVFELRNATLQDSGTYHCGVIRDGKYSGNGTGSSLTVWVAPTPLKILLKPLASKPSTSLTLVCQTAAFYPDDLTLFWYKDGTNITAEMNPIKQRNSEGLYEVSSSLEEPQPVRDDAVYICLVTHISLPTPAIAIHTVTNSCPDSAGKYRYLWAIRCTVGGLVFLVLIIIIGAEFCLKNKGNEA